MSPELSPWDRRDGLSDRREWVEQTLDSAGNTWWTVHRAGEVLAVAMFASAEAAGAFVAGMITERKTR